MKRQLGQRRGESNFKQRAGRISRAPIEVEQPVQQDEYDQSDHRAYAMTRSTNPAAVLLGATDYTQRPVLMMGSWVG